MPILNPTVHKQVLNEVLVQNVLDEENSWTLAADGTYARVAPAPEPGAKRHNAHEYFRTHESLSGRSPSVARPGDEAYHFTRGYEEK